MPLRTGLAHLLAGDKQLPKVSDQIRDLNGKIAEDGACDRRGRLYRLTHVQGTREGGPSACGFDNLLHGHEWAVKWGPVRKRRHSRSRETCGRLCQVQA